MIVRGFWQGLAFFLGVGVLLYVSLGFFFFSSGKISSCIFLFLCGVMGGKFFLLGVLIFSSNLSIFGEGVRFRGGRGNAFRDNSVS